MRCLQCETVCHIAMRAAAPRGLDAVSGSSPGGMLKILQFLLPISFDRVEILGFRVGRKQVFPLKKERKGQVLKQIRCCFQQHSEQRHHPVQFCDRAVNH